MHGSLCVPLQVPEQDGRQRAKGSVLSKRCPVRLMGYSELGCGLEKDATVDTHTPAADAAVHGSAQIWVCVYKGTVEPLSIIQLLTNFKI